MSELNSQANRVSSNTNDCVVTSGSEMMTDNENSLRDIQYIALENARIANDRRSATLRFIGDVSKTVGSIIVGAFGLVGLGMVIRAEDEEQKILPGSRMSFVRSLFPKP